MILLRLPCIMSRCSPVAAGKLLIVGLSWLLILDGEALARTEVVVVVGAPGEAAYGHQFNEWSQKWKSAAEKARAGVTVIGEAPAGGNDDRAQLEKALQGLAGESDDVLWLVMIGHGTFDGRVAKFNLRGPDVSAEQLSAWLKLVRRPLAVVQCASASAPFINRLSGEGRVVITATKSGDEKNFARFGQYIASAISDPAADLDKDSQVSLLEAYLTACRQVEEFYAGGARLATEHALLDDNGDGLGSPAAWFKGVRATRRAKESKAIDGVRAHQLHLVPSAREQQMPAEVRKRRDELELKIAAHRENKTAMPEEKYYERLEELMVALARVYDGAGDAAHGSVPRTDAGDAQSGAPTAAELARRRDQSRR